MMWSNMKTVRNIEFDTHGSSADRPDDLWRMEVERKWIAFVKEQTERNDSEDRATTYKYVSITAFAAVPDAGSNAARLAVQQRHNRAGF